MLQHVQHGLHKNILGSLGSKKNAACIDSEKVFINTKIKIRHFYGPFFYFFFGQNFFREIFSMEPLRSFSIPNDSSTPNLRSLEEKFIQRKNQSSILLYMLFFRSKIFLRNLQHGAFTIVGHPKRFIHAKFEVSRRNFYTQKKSKFDFTLCA